MVVNLMFLLFRACIPFLLLCNGPFRCYVGLMQWACRACMDQDSLAEKREHAPTLLAL